MLFCLHILHVSIGLLDSLTTEVRLYWRTVLRIPQEYSFCEIPFSQNAGLRFCLRKSRPMAAVYSRRVRWNPSIIHSLRLYIDDSGLGPLANAGLQISI